MKTLRETLYVNESLDRDDFVKVYTLFMLELLINSDDLLGDMDIAGILDRHGLEDVHGEDLPKAMLDNPALTVDLFRDVIDRMDRNNLLDKEDKRKMLLLILPKVKQALQSKV